MLDPGTLFLVPFALSLVVLGVCERFVYAVLTLFSWGARSKHESARHVVGGAVHVSATVVSGVVSVFVRCIYGAAQLVMWFTVIFLLLSAVYQVYEEYPSVILNLYSFYNARIGGFVHGYFFLPLEFFNLLFKGLIPLYNGGIWLLRTLFIQGLLPLLWDQIAILIEAATVIVSLGRHCTESLSDFLAEVGCDALDRCLTNPASLDLVTPMGDVRALAVLGGKLVGSMCSILQEPVNFLMYPLLDVNLAQAIHGFGNALVHFFVHLPIVSMHRCVSYGVTGGAFDFMMCTPDLNPVFVHLISGLRDLGNLVDNWIGVGVVMTSRATTGGVSTECSGLKTLAPDVFRNGNLLLGRIAVVGLTDWLMASTNGSIAYFYGQVNSDTAPRAWTEEVDVRMGLAAVSYNDVNDMDVSTLTSGRRPGSRRTTTLMGCRCVDTDQGINVRCSFLPYAGALSSDSGSMDLWFQDRTWAKDLTCEKVEITVRSVRWPVRRVEGKTTPFGAGTADLPTTDCLTKGTCESVDATVWLVPRCDLLPAEQCSDVAVGTSCFPFCMAARVAGSRNANPVLVNADTWRTGRQLLGRECVSRASDSSTVISMAQLTAASGTTTTVNFGQTTLGGAASDPLYTVDYDTKGAAVCSTGVNTASWVPKPTTDNVLPYVRRHGQPFAISGDTILMDNPLDDGGTQVQVERLGGNQQDVFTLERTWNDLPAAPKRLVPIDELRMDVSDKLVVPYDYTATRIHSTNSRNYVFYAVSPNLQIFEAYLDYCLYGAERLPQFQLMALSSYGPLRVYRVRAYCQTECASDGLSAQVTLDGFAKDGSFNSGTFRQGCDRTFNATIDGLEYVNEQNIAVTVQVADRSFNVDTMSGAGSKYVTYWLHPQSMQLRNDTMWTAPDSISYSASICIPGLAVPHLGTLKTELLISGLHALRFVVTGVWYAPGLVFMWKGGGTCPLVSRGHSVLASCGDDVFSLDDFFDSADQATAVFWSIPMYIADILDSRRVVSFAPVQNLLRGFSTYGRETTSILTSGGNLINLLQTPMPSQISELFAVIRQPNLAASSGKMALGVNSMARFTARAYAKIILDSAKVSFGVGTVDSMLLFRQFLSAVYDLRPYFKTSVSDRAGAACLGIEQMFGGYNPWGRLVYHQCMAAPILMEGMLDLFVGIFIDVPTIKCVCKDSAGHTLTVFARQECVPKAPASVRGVLLGMIAAAEGTGQPSLLCPAVTTYVRKSLSNSVEPWFGQLYSTLDALGDSIDYALVGIDPDAGQCSNFHQDPQIVVIMPEPMDYFQACGKIQSCHTKCAGNWQVFQDALVAAGGIDQQTGLVSMTQEVDSMFFPVPGVDIIATGNVVALTRPTGSGLSACRSSADQVLAVASITRSSLSVLYYCIPAGPSSSVYASENTALNWQSMRARSATQVSFLDGNGATLAALIMESNQTVLYRVGRGISDQQLLATPDILSLITLGQYPMRITNFITLGARLLVNVAVRTNENSQFGRTVSTVWIDPDAPLAFRDGKPAPPFPFVVSIPNNMWTGYAVSEYPSSGDTNVFTLLFWPIQSNAVAQRVRFRVTSSSVSVTEQRPYVQDKSLSARASLMPQKLILCKNLQTREDLGQLNVYASSGNAYDWLQLLRLKANDLVLHSAAVSNAQPISTTVSITTACDGTDCRGCKDLNLRALCAAYQSCSVVRCIGTPVNLKRPLCGVGMALRSVGMLAVESTHGSWLMIIDIFMILVEITTQRNLPGIDVSWPDEAFLGNMCVAKDLSAEFFGILMSTINSALQLAQVPVPSLQQVSHVDSSANTALSLSTAAMTSFLHQIGLAPLYVMAVSHKIMMCQAKGMLAVFSNAGFTVNLEPSNLVKATDAISGQCITQKAEIEAQQSGDSVTSRSVGATIGQMISSSAQVQLLRKIEPMMHMIDGGLTYAIGIVGKFANVLQTWDLAHCMLPDVTIKNAVQCACGDTPLAILAARRTEGIDDFAYWCTGTVSVIDSNNKARVVWNPYTYQQLQDKLAGRMDDYVRCASTSLSCTVPNDDVFASQGISMMTVLTRCRQNFVNQQWDPAAFAMYDKNTLNLHVPGAVRPRVKDPSDGVGACLLRSSETGATNGACLDALSRQRGWTDTYWGYNQLEKGVGSHRVDACMVFSGPAANAEMADARRKPFQNCLNGYQISSSNVSCDLSGFVWSPASSNTVPVASRHVIEPEKSDVLNAVNQRMRTAKELVMTHLTALRNYNNSALEVAFFSAEGDMIHQMLDCIFLGPYARMDYWPTPVCNESSSGDCLVGPYWSRDESRGRTRKIDLATCPANGDLPFTCGSPTRRAMVKHFVMHYLQGTAGSSLVLSQVRDWLSAQELLWNDERAFGCDCPEGSAAKNSVTCCQPDATGSYLPTFFTSTSLDLPTEGVLNAMEQRFKTFYREATNDADPWIFFLNSNEKAKYNWATSSGAHRVSDEAVYSTTSPTVQYGPTEARSPPRRSSDPTIWRICHGALKQVMFSMPTNEDGTLKGSAPLFGGGGPDAIAAHVEALTQAAYESSPLFRHYQPRHHPSQSWMCAGNATEPASRGSATFTDYMVNGVLIQDGKELGSIPVLGFLAGRLGSYAASCFCGWTQNGEWCVAPEAACLSLQLPSNCSYRVSEQNVSALGKAFVAGAWTCPHLELSEHLGFLDPSATERWLQGNVALNTSGEFLLRYGPGGLKSGNVLSTDATTLGLSPGTTASLAQVLRNFLAPTDRIVDPTLATVYGCSEHSKTASDLTDEFVESLFPMAQGITETGVGAYCLRYAVELSRLKALELMMGLDENFTHMAAAQQKSVVLLWRRRCGSQVQVIGLCNALDMYHANGLQVDNCLQPWTLVTDPSVEMYATPECLVKIGDYFYDPCVCNPYICAPDAQPVSLTRAAVEKPECRLRFDPRKVVRAAELGWWGADETDPSASAANAWLASPWNMLDQDQLMAQLLQSSDGGGAGNTPSGVHWGAAEGFMNETAEHCDMIADYWPEAGYFPVGYHVTPLCDSGETAYRSFDNVFAREDTADGVVLVYYEDQTRERDLVDSHFGAGGACRLTNFGFDMYETNTMRVCTRMSSGENVDVHVPLGGNGMGSLGKVRCSESSTDLPWANADSYDYYDPAFHSVGTVPNLPPPTARTYPDQADRYMRIGPQHRMRTEGWGDHCQDFVLPNCSAGWTCPTDFYCADGGVCMHVEVECNQHSDCPTGTMCTGLGTCVLPRVTVVNEMGGSASFRAHTSSCPGEEFSMQGGSYWGYIPDILEAHGMCSYRHWQEYLYTLSQCSCSNHTADSCLLNASQCQYYVFDKTKSNNQWWDSNSTFPNRLKMIPTTCDRDYERFRMNGAEMKSCVPRAGQVRLMLTDNSQRSYADRDPMWKPYDEVTRRIPLRLMPYKSNTSFGFLGFSTDPNIDSCTRFQQCYADVFTKNGVPAMLTGSIKRPNRTLLTGALYNPDDVFRCGVIGYFDNGVGKCRIDQRIFPLYYMLCTETHPVRAQCLPVISVSDLLTTCASIVNPYDQKYSIIHDVNVPALIRLFQIFKQPQTLQEHFSTVSCANSLYDAMSKNPFDSKGFYFPLTFTLFEFPFPWFYQCVIGSRISPQQSLDHVLYPCSFFESTEARTNGVAYTPLAPNSAFGNYIFAVRAGYNEATVRATVSSQLANAQAKWTQCINTKKSLYYAATDNSYPMCYTEKRWNLPVATLPEMKLIESYVRPNCASSMRAKYYSQYTRTMTTPPSVINLVDSLTHFAGAEQAQTSGLEPLLTNKLLQFGLDHLRDNSATDLLSIRDVSVNNKYPVRFDPSLPPPTDPLFFTALTQWRPSYLPNTKDIMNRHSDACNASDIKRIFKDSAGVDHSEWDTDKLNGLDSWVTTCQLYQIGVGGCHLPPITVGTNSHSLDGTTPDPEQAFDRYVSALYQDVKNCYDDAVSASATTDFPLIAPTTLPFFQEEASLEFKSSFQFDLTNAQKYMNNIEPDVNTPVMCRAGNQTIDYSQCTDSNFQALRDHVSTAYTKNAGVVIPDQYQMDWTVDRTMLSTGAIYSYASTKRDTSRQFLSSLFDPSVCQANNIPKAQRLCAYRSSGSIKVATSVSPWMSGGWNPYDQCDVDQTGPENGYTETINVQCLYDTYCPPDKEYDVDYYKNMPYKQACINKQGEKTKKINVDSSSTYNLCRHTLKEDSICMHNQGMLGGTDGMPMEEYATNGNLFSLHNFTGVPEGDGYPLGNVLLAGGASDYGFVRIPLAHIGGHHLGMIITNSTMRMFRLPLKPAPDNARMRQWDSLDVQDWIPQWIASMAQDDAEYFNSIRDIAFTVGTDSDDGTPLLGWDCALRRRAFYGGGVNEFPPSLPSARRSERTFEDMTGGRYAHPTQKHANASKLFGYYETTNGFCFCPISDEVAPGMCSVLNSDLKHNCSLYKTVRAMRGKEWGWTHTFTPMSKTNEYKRCTMQLDWPFIPGTLRDGGTIDTKTPGSDAYNAWATASETESQRCHVLDRTQPFAYLFKSANQLNEAGFNTLDRGACHTGRTQDALRTHDAQRCVRVGDTDGKTVQLMCVDNTAPTTARRKSQTSSESAYSYKFQRRRCSQCSKPPAFKSKQGTTIGQETSFGIPYRRSVERTLANDLRKALCQGSSSCLSLLNRSAWRPGNFLRAYLSNPTSLFANASSSLYSTSFAGAPPVNDDRMWAKEWAYCPSPEALRTGVNCTGSITKAQWRGDKVHSCYSAINSALNGKEDPMAKTNICALDGRLDSLCQAIRTAQSLIASANCLASGSDKCALQEYVYTPATWETTNQAFVHETVEAFYKRTDGGCADPNDCICPTDAVLAAFRLNNSHMLAQCPAVSIMVLQEVLKGVRSLIVPICQALSRVLSMAINLMLTLTPSMSVRATAMDQAFVDWAELKRLVSGTGGTVSDLFFDLLFNTGRLGTWLRTVILDGCGAVNSVYRFIGSFGCSLIMEQLPMFLGNLRVVSTWIDIGFTVVNDVFQVVLRNYLPNAMMDLYQSGYRNFFQTSKYKEKQAAYATQATLDAANLAQGRPMSLEDRVKKLESRESKTINSLGSAIEAEKSGVKAAKSSAGLLSVLGPIGIIGGILDLGITGYQMYNDAQMAMKIAKAAADFPDTLTLFDFNSFWEGIDKFAKFLESDLTCFTMDPTQDLISCAVLEVPPPDMESIDSMAPLPSACWADAQQRQVSVSTLYACTPTSTCCQDGVNCGKPQLCGDCPVPSSTAFRTYGCDTLTQRCQCGLPAFDVSKCVAQRDCGPTTSCSLLTSMNDVSFGAIKTCSSCSVPPICLIGSDSVSGKCTCLPTGDTEVDRCSNGAGSVTFPNPVHLCGYATDAGAYFFWPELALVQCANLNSPVCSEVVTEQGTTLYMPVGSRLRGMQFAYSSRRLLSFESTNASAAPHFGLPRVFSPDDPADDITPELLHDMLVNRSWNHTAAPCATLAHAYQQGQKLGPVDESALHSCVYWRNVGKKLIADYALQTLENFDTFLLSPDDLAAALGQRGVVEELILRKPLTLLVAAMYSPWMKPVRALLIASHAPNVSRILQGIRIPWQRNISALFPNSTVVFPRGRRLLGLVDDVEAEIHAMPYYSQIKSVADQITLPTVDVSVASAVAQSWLRDGFTWRKTVFQGTCAPIQVVWGSSTQVVRTLRQYYLYFAQIHAPRNIPRSLRAILPDLRAPAGATPVSATGRISETPVGSTRGIGATMLGWVMRSLGVTWGDVAWFLSDPCSGKDCTEANRWTLTYLLESVTFCDFEAVTYCNRQRRDMASSLLFALIVYLVFQTVFTFVGVPAMGKLVFYAIPFFVLWYSTGTSPACLPMLPTCLLDDFLLAAKGILPATAAVPPLLLSADGRSLRSCAELQFTSWRDPIAFGMCELGMCGVTVNSTYLPGFYWDATQKQAQVDSADVGAYRLCALVTSAESMPVFLLISLAILFLSSVVLTVLNVVPPLLTMVWHVVSFNHAPAE